MKRFLARPTNFLNRNTGFLILVAIIVFGLISIGFQRDNTAILSDTSAAVKNTERILSNLEQAVTDLKEDSRTVNDEQTVILCNLILDGGVDLETDDAAEVERICQERIAESQMTSTPQAVPSSQSPAQPGNSERPNPPNPPSPTIFETLLPNGLEPTACSLVPFYAEIKPCHTAKLDNQIST